MSLLVPCVWLYVFVRLNWDANQLISWCLELNLLTFYYPDPTGKIEFQFDGLITV